MSDAELKAAQKCEEACRTGDVEAAREAFNSFDKNHDNRVSKDEFFQVICKFQDDAEKLARFEALYKASDANADGTLDFEEFQFFLREIVRDAWSGCS
jgi:Ca2+-binding EF-hand superfamily protein